MSKYIILYKKQQKFLFFLSELSYKQIEIYNRQNYENNY